MAKYKYNITELCMTFLEGRRFYATILSKLVKIPTDKIETAGVGFNSNGKLSLMYNECYLLGLPLAKAQAVLEHEVLHIFFRHLVRHAKDGDAWLDNIKNLGLDCSINQYLQNMPEKEDIIQFFLRLDPNRYNRADLEKTILDGAVYPKTYGLENEKNADYYIEELKKKFPRKEQCPTCGQPQQGKNQQDKQGQGQDKDKQEQGQEKCPTCGQPANKSGVGSHDFWGKMIDDNGELSDIKNQDIDPEYEVQAVVMKAIKECKDFGNLPAFVKKEIELLKKIKRYNWKHELKVFVNSVLTVSKRLSQKRVNRRFADMEYILAGKKKARKPKLLLVRDTSGSMYDDKIQQELTNEMLHIAKFCTVFVADCDTEVHQVYKIQKQKDFKEYQGGGGTSFKPAFKKAKELKVDGLVYLTDTYGDFPDKKEIGKYATKTIWVTFDNEKVELPFGKHVNITTEGD